MTSSVVPLADPATGSLPAYAEQLPQPLRSGHEWFCAANRAAFEDYLGGLKDAHSLGLTTQVDLYKHEVIDLFAHDLAQRTQTLVASRFSQPGTGARLSTDRKVEIVRGERYPLPKTFTVPIRDYYTANGDHVQEYWAYQQLESYGELVPPQALSALVLVSQQPVTPDQAWVAVREERRTSARRLLDPWLCVSFGRWVVQIAEWK